MLKPGDPAPPFDLPCALDDKISHVSLGAIRSEMVVVFFYPHDFSFICPTEVAGFHQQQPAFAAERATIVGISVDDTETHRRWSRELGGISYPLAADAGGKIAIAYGVFDAKEQAALRATFILDPQREVIYAMASPINVGRSVGETLRVVRAIRTGQMCPADWRPGDGFGPAGQKY
ncbi:MAG: redoxin domain-containing protein [Candidatus Binataceae bacterium]|jgi:alkyl hydroperoxide reductase subunit AhpC